MEDPGPEGPDTVKLFLYLWKYILHPVQKTETWIGLFPLNQKGIIDNWPHPNHTVPVRMVWVEKFVLEIRFWVLTSVGVSCVFSYSYLRRDAFLQRWSCFSLVTLLKQIKNLKAVLVSNGRQVLNCSNKWTNSTLKAGSQRDELCSPGFILNGFAVLLHLSSPLGFILSPCLKMLIYFWFWCRCLSWGCLSL